MRKIVEQFKPASPDDQLHLYIQAFDKACELFYSETGYHVKYSIVSPKSVAYIVTPIYQAKIEVDMTLFRNNKWSQRFMVDRLARGYFKKMSYLFNEVCFETPEV